MMKKLKLSMALFGQSLMLSMMFQGTAMWGSEAPVSYHSILPRLRKPQLTWVQRTRIQNNWNLSADRKNQLLEKGLTLAQENQLNSLFRYRAYIGDREELKHLAFLGADVDCGRITGRFETETYSPILEAIQREDTATVRTLIALGAQVRGLPDSWKLLTVAARKGCRAIVALLTEAGADVNANPGWTSPLVDAILAQNNDIINVLFGAGADPNVYCGEYRGTPLMIAVSHSSLKVVDLLIEAGADINRQGNDYSNTALIEAALSCAAYRDDFEACAKFVRLLLAGADWTIEDNQGRTAFDILRSSVPISVTVNN